MNFPIIPIIFEEKYVSWKDHFNLIEEWIIQSKKYEEKFWSRDMMLSKKNKNKEIGIQIF